jgi:hypothetical protein
LRKCIPAPCSWCGFINFAEQRVVPAEREQERSEGTINPRRIQLSTLLFIHSQMRNSFMFFFNHVIIHDHDQITICTQNIAGVVYTYTPQHRQRMGRMSYSQIGTLPNLPNRGRRDGNQISSTTIQSSSPSENSSAMVVPTMQNPMSSPSSSTSSSSPSLASSSPCSSTA